jgi:CubicO group peptidase (beta-lactamase class C family)
MIVVLAAACGDDDTTAEAPAPDGTTAPADPAPPAEPDEPAGDGAPADDPADAELAGDAQAWPVPEWETIDPEAAGFDPEALDAIGERAEAAGSSCLVITRDGQLVREWNWGEREPDDLREAFSVTKSITSTLVGIAQDRGQLDIDDPASDYIEQWQGTPSDEVTIRNLISNDSGRYWNYEDDFGTLPGSEDQTTYAIGLEQQHEPGTEWAYNNSAIQTLEAVLEEATGTEVVEFAQEALFEPIGMESDIATDDAGNTLTYMGAQTNCRDLARFGLLFLRGGEWDGQQIVSEEFVEEAVTPSQELNEEYGFLWWLRGGDTFMALGLTGQVTAVFPSDDLVVTRMSGEEAEEGASFGGDEIDLLVPSALTHADDELAADDAADDE